MAKRNKKIYEALLDKGKELAEQYQKTDVAEYIIHLEKGEEYIKKTKVLVLDRPMLVKVNVHVGPQDVTSVYFDYKDDDTIYNDHLCHVLVKSEPYFTNNIVKAIFVRRRTRDIDIDFIALTRHVNKKEDFKVVEQVMSQFMLPNGKVVDMFMDKSSAKFYEFFINFMKKEENYSVLTSKKILSKDRMKFFDEKDREAREIYRDMVRKRKEENPENKKDQENQDNKE